MTEDVIGLMDVVICLGLIWADELRARDRAQHGAKSRNHSRIDDIAEQWPDPEQAPGRPYLPRLFRR